MDSFWFNLIVISMTLGSALTEKPRCRKTMFALTREFTSPNYPLYPANSNCEYVIRSNGSYFIEIVFTKFQLQPPENGVITDYVRILDGSVGNRRQDVTFNGTQTAPFTFRSQASKLSVIFVSDNSLEFSGFKAVYRFVKRCKPFEIENGRAKCDLTKAGLVMKCDAVCDKKYILQGQAKCMDGVVLKPQCVMDPVYSCNITRLQQYKPKCNFNPATGEMKKCKYSCQKGFVTKNNGVIRCVNGVLDNKPICVPNPKKLKNRNQAPKTNRASNKQPPKASNCPAEFCWISKVTKSFVVKCVKYANDMQKKFKESYKTRKMREKRCFKCQSIRCTDGVDGLLFA